MWGICLDWDAIQEGLFQAVIQYEIDENGEAVITLPETAFKPNLKHIRQIAAPKFIYGQQVSPCNHSDMIGVICGISWHFKSECCYYFIKVNEKVKSKRYYEDDLKLYSF